MSTYVMSDLHGRYQEFQKMLEMIDFSETDMLYILGDIIDRGDGPIEILEQLMGMQNVVILAGNHELMLCDCCKFLMQEVTEESIDQLDLMTFRMFMNWQYNGGATTLKGLQRLDVKRRREIIEFILDFEAYVELEIEGKSYILVHAGLGNFSPEKNLWDYEIEELVWKRPDYTQQYFNNRYVITGHTPTQVIQGAKPGYIYQNQNHIAIDCGAGTIGGRLACLRLEDMKEFYVDVAGKM